MGRCLFMRKGDTHTVPGSRLPSGYTELAYIQSSGTQYIDTGFNPNQDTGITIDYEMVGTSNQYLFGCRGTKWGDAMFCCSSLDGDTTLQDQYGAEYKNTTVSAKARRFFEKSKSITSVDGTEISSFSSQTFQTPVSLYLFAANFNGSITMKASEKLYSCKIYDNGTLIRDYVPCINASGEVGLYDLVGKQFYGNSGTGVFTGSEVA